MVKQDLTVIMDCDCGGLKSVVIHSPKMGDEVTHIHMDQINEGLYTTAERNLIMGRVAFKISRCYENCAKSEGRNDD